MNSKFNSDITIKMFSFNDNIVSVYKSGDVYNIIFLQETSKDIINKFEIEFADYKTNIQYGDYAIPLI